AHGVGGPLDVLHVGLAMTGERGRHTDYESIGLAEPLEVRRRLEPAAAEEGIDAIGSDLPDVADAGIELFDFPGIDIEAEDGEPCLGEAQHEGKADVAEADDANGDLPSLDLPFQEAELRTVVWNLRNHLTPRSAGLAPRVSKKHWTGARNIRYRVGMA